MRKIIVCIVVGFSIVISSVFFVGCQKQKQSFPALNELKEMSGAECLELFEEYGMVLPAEYKDHEVKTHQHPHANHCFSYFSPFLTSVIFLTKKNDGMIRPG